VLGAVDARLAIADRLAMMAGHRRHELDLEVRP
jgi:hypothetical protein